jgi:hypothetical protein
MGNVLNTPLKISRILHAGYVFQHAETKIAFDPIFENPFSHNCYAFPNVEFNYELISELKFEAVFISHYHDDHCSLDSLNYLDKSTPIYIYCIFEELFEMIKELGFTEVYPLWIDKAVKIGTIEVIPRRALDVEVDSIFQITAAGLNVLNVVDSWIDHETLERLAKSNSWDLIIWPFQTMRELEVLTPSRAADASRELPPEWLEQLKILNPKYIVPSSCQFRFEHWSWYNKKFFPITYRQFNKEIQLLLPEVKVVRLNPSVSIELFPDSLNLTLPLEWMRSIGEQDVEYDYTESLKLPTTAEIAKHFQALSLEQTEKVFAYCELGLIEKYHSMELSPNSYFETSRYWRLSVYDHNGNEKSFHYQIHGKVIHLLAEPKEPISWLTELPLAKLYAAIEQGESLTSMYFRINDIVFSPEVEDQIKEVEPVEDPLIRCLYNGAFGSYQKAQLKKIKNFSSGNTQKI